MVETFFKIINIKFCQQIVSLLLVFLKQEQTTMVFILLTIDLLIMLF